MSSFCLDSAFWFRVHIQVTLHVLMVFWQEHRRAGGVFVADHIPRVPNEEESSFFSLSFFEVSETHQQSSLCQSDRSTTHCRVLSMHPKYIYTVHACHYSSYTTLQVLLWMCARMYICVAAHFEQVIRNSGSAPRCCRRRRRFWFPPSSSSSLEHERSRVLYVCVCVCVN